MGDAALGGPTARAADQMLKCSLNGVTVSGTGSQGLGHITVCGSNTRKLTEPVRGKPHAPKTEATKTDHDRGTALAGTKGPGFFYEYLFKKIIYFIWPCWVLVSALWLGSSGTQA